MNNTTIQTTSVNCPDEDSQNYYICITIFACSLNLILFLLIRTDTHPLMRPYLRILYSSVIIDFLSALFQFSSQARPSIMGEYHLLTIIMDGFLPRIADNFEIFKGGNLNYVLVLESWACYIVIFYCWLPFVYRYLIVCWNYQMGKLIFALILGVVLSLTLTAAILINHLSARAYDSNVQIVPIPDPNCLRYLPQMSERRNLGNPYDRTIFVLWYSCSVIFQWSYLIIVFCSIRIYIFLRKQTDLISTQNKSIQWQISLTIFSQALCPFIIFFGPAQILKWISDKSSLHTLMVGIFYKTIYSSYTIIPLVNPLVAICFISSYRKTLLQFFVQLIYKLPGFNQDSEGGMGLFQRSTATVSVPIS